MFLNLSVILFTVGSSLWTETLPWQRSSVQRHSPCTDNSLTDNAGMHIYLLTKLVIWKCSNKANYHWKHDAHNLLWDADTFRPRLMLPEVQSRGISSPTKKTDIFQCFFFKKSISLRVRIHFSQILSTLSRNLGNWEVSEINCKTGVKFH